MDIDQDKDFDKLAKIAIETGNILQGFPIPVEESIRYSEGFGQKIMRHILTASHLSNGYQLAIGDNIFEPMIDFGSVIVITRAAFETYLTFHFLSLTQQTVILGILDFFAGI